jgi:hypothetical protein
MLESVIMFGRRKRDFLKSSFFRGAGDNVGSSGQMGGYTPARRVRVTQSARGVKEARLDFLPSLSMYA